MDMSLEQCISEFIDNQIDANASVCKFWLGYLEECKSHAFICIDNGDGMSENQIEESLKMHNRNPATKKNGKFGQGGVWASIVLTEAKGRHIRMSCVDKENIHMCEINWERARAENKLNRKSHELTKTGDKIWERFSITNMTSGTIDVLCISEERYIELYENIFKKKLANNYVFSFSYMYNYWLESLKISFSTDDEERLVPAFNPLLWKEIIDEDKDTFVVKLYKHSQDNKQQYTYIFQQKNTTNKKKFYYFPEKKPIVFQVDKHVLVGEFVIKFSYCDFELLKNKLKECHIIKQNINISTEYQKNFTGLFFERNHRVLAKLDPLPIQQVGGDEWKRSFYRNVKTKVEFDHHFDDIFKIQVNKSKINLKDFDGNFDSFLENLTKKFASDTKTWNDISDEKKKQKKEEKEKKEEKVEKKREEKKVQKVEKEEKKEDKRVAKKGEKNVKKKSEEKEKQIPVQENIQKQDITEEKNVVDYYKKIADENNNTLDLTNDISMLYKLLDKLEKMDRKETKDIKEICKLIANKATDIGNSV